MRRIFYGGYGSRKSELVRLTTEAMLDQGKTVVICRPTGTHKVQRVWRKGRKFDIIEPFKLASESKWRSTSG